MRTKVTQVGRRRQNLTDQERVLGNNHPDTWSRRVGMPGLHVHDLRHTGNQFAANSGAGLRDLMARMAYDSERAAMIYQHEARGADKAITDAIDRHVDDEHRQDDDGPAGALVPA